MSKDDYQDIRLFERIGYENSHVDLSNLSTKIESFISQKTPKLREKEKKDLLHQDNILHSQSTRPLPSMIEL